LIGTGRGDPVPGDLMQAVHASRVALLDMAAKAVLADAQEADYHVDALRISATMQAGDAACEVELLNKRGEPIGGLAL
jgi:hypothetical protein